jgi:hypothetical protein
MADVVMGFLRFTFSKSKTEFNSDLAPCDVRAFPTMNWSSEAGNFEVINDLEHVFEKWVEHCMKVLRKRDRHCTSTTFRLELIR